MSGLTLNKFISPLKTWVESRVSAIESILTSSRFRLPLIISFAIATIAFNVFSPFVLEASHYSLFIFAAVFAVLSTLATLSWLPLILFFACLHLLIRLYLPDFDYFGFFAFFERFCSADSFWEILFSNELLYQILCWGMG